jgi:3-hydroxyacyl-CoA dehydrogenase
MSSIDYSVSGGVCVLRLASPPLNALGLALLDELRACIERAGADDSARGIVLTGAADHFSAGADLGLFRAIATAEKAMETSRLFQEAFAAVEASAKPVVAAVAGRVMGSALELAMACHFRVADAAARFSMPEVTLGINPGGGGTQRLPRLIGVAPALDMLLTGRASDARRASELGLVDAVCEGAHLVACAGDLLASAAAPRRTAERSDKLQDAAANEAAFGKAQELLAGVRPEIVAPSRIVEAVRAGLAESFAAGLRKEQEAFAECMATDAARNRIHLFFATREMGKAPALATVRGRAVRQAAVVGMGSMGTGIAHALLLAGLPVTAVDADPSALQRGAERIRASLAKRVEQGKLAAERADAMGGLLAATTDRGDIAAADLVIEAVFENVEAKRAVLDGIEDVCADDAVIATNTSTISLDVLAERMRRGNRLIGLHFFNPAHVMPLVEVVRREATPDGVIATALRFAKAIRKTPVLVRNREGFLVNRIFVPYLKEAFRLLEEGADPPAVDEAMVEFGFPMGPLVLIDMAGLDILAAVDAVMSRAFPAHGPLPAVAAGLVERGHVGQKSGSGVYAYRAGDRSPRRSEVAAEVIAEARRQGGGAAAALSSDEITRRLVLRMVAEAFRVLAEGIAQRESDIDAAVVLGVGFPDFRGGPIRYARNLGLGSVRTQLEELAEGLGERFAPCEALRETKGDA